MDYFLILPATLFPNHLAAFGRRCGQPGQQHGRRFPWRKSCCNRSICSARVSGFLTIVTQQIHSLRASGVSPFQSSNSFGTLKNTSFISLGTVWTTPELRVTLVMQLLYQIFEESIKKQDPPEVLYFYWCGEGDLPTEGEIRSQLVCFRPLRPYSRSRPRLLSRLLTGKSGLLISTSLPNQ